MIILFVSAAAGVGSLEDAAKSCNWRSASSLLRIVRHISEIETFYWIDITSEYTDICIYYRASSCPLTRYWYFLTASNANSAKFAEIIQLKNSYKNVLIQKQNRTFREPWYYDRTLHGESTLNKRNRIQKKRKYIYVLYVNIYRLI